MQNGHEGYRIINAPDIHMEKEKLLSVVVPVYKVEQYINKCLDSLVMDDPELMELLEVIIVNDGTPDKSAEMSREYVKRYPGTFRQIDKENGGHGSAWNVGLGDATGKYIRFLDSDDWFSNLDRLIQDLQGCDADIVLSPFNKYYAYENRNETIYAPIAPGSTQCPDYWGGNDVNFWGATYRTSILKPLLPLFAEGVMFDDYILTWTPLVYGRTCFALDYIVYNYLIGRPEQTMASTKKRRGAISYVKCFEQCEAVRSRISTVDIPADNLSKIDDAVKGYASYIFAYMLYLPYREAKNRMKYFWDHYLSDYEFKSQLEKRYERFSFPVFYLIECLRRTILNR